MEWFRDSRVRNEAVAQIWYPWYGAMHRIMDISYFLNFNDTGFLYQIEIIVDEISEQTVIRTLQRLA